MLKHAQKQNTSIGDRYCNKQRENEATAATNLWKQMFCRGAKLQVCRETSHRMGKNRAPCQAMTTCTPSESSSFLKSAGSSLLVISILICLRGTMDISATKPNFV